MQVIHTSSILYHYKWLTWIFCWMQNLRNIAKCQSSNIKRMTCNMNVHTYIRLNDSNVWMTIWLFCMSIINTVTCIQNLTLLNTDMSKKTTFAWFYLLKSLFYQRLFISLQHENPPSLSTMLKCAGRFFFYGYMATRIPFIKTYSTPQKLVQLLKTRGMEMTLKLY